MRVSKIKISNILGIESMEINPGQITKIEGKNGAGKSSALEAIKAVLKGGHQAELLRNGADEGEVVLVLDDGRTITKTVTADESKTTLTHPEHGKIAKPMAFVNGLTDDMSLNPIKFLECKAADRADLLLEAMPLEANLAEIGEIIAPAVLGQSFSKIPQGHALKAIDTVYEQIFQFRQDINRTAKEKKSTVEQLSASLPEVAVAGPEIRAEILNLETELNRKKVALAEAQRELDSKRHSLESEAQKFYSEKNAEAEKEYQEALAKITEKRDTAKREATATAQKMDQRALEDWAASKPEDPTILETASKIQAARQTLEEAIRHQNTADVVAKMIGEATLLQEKSDACSEALQGLKDYKNKLLQDLPIKGIEIRDGQVFKDGVPFDTLNTAAQVQVAVDLAKLRAKDLGLICVDGAECLDSERLAALEDAIGKTDLQMVMTCVSDKELTITTK